MPRAPKSFWRSSRSAWYVTVNGRQYMLRYPDGSPVAKDDHAGRAAAMHQVFKEQNAPKAARRPAEDALTVGEVFKRYIAASIDAGRKKRTIDGHRQALRSIGRFKVGGRALHTLNAASLTIEHWHAFQVHMQERGLGPRTITRTFASLKACWRWASRPVVGRTPARLIRSNPFGDAILGLKPERRRVRAPITREQAQEILSAIDASDLVEGLKLIAHIQAASGCRTSEACHLRWDQWKGTHFEIAADESKTGWKTGRPRFIPVPPTLAKRIEAWKGRGHAVFVGKARDGAYGDRPPGRELFAKRFAEVAKLAGFPAVRPYCFRDLVATELRGNPVADLVLGNSSQVRADHYERVRPEDLIKAITSSAAEPEE